jgi:hypothetical protein
MNGHHVPLELAKFFSGRNKEDKESGTCWVFNLVAPHWLFRSPQF